MTRERIKTIIVVAAVLAVAWTIFAAAVQAAEYHLTGNISDFATDDLVAGDTVYICGEHGQNPQDWALHLIAVNGVTYDFDCPGNPGSIRHKVETLKAADWTEVSPGIYEQTGIAGVAEVAETDAGDWLWRDAALDDCNDFDHTAGVFRMRWCGTNLPAEVYTGGGYITYRDTVGITLKSPRISNASGGLRFYNPTDVWVAGPEIRNLRGTAIDVRDGSIDFRVTDPRISDVGNGIYASAQSTPLDYHIGGRIEGGYIMRTRDAGGQTDNHCIGGQSWQGWTIRHIYLADCNGGIVLYGLYNKGAGLFDNTIEHFTIAGMDQDIGTNEQTGIAISGTNDPSAEGLAGGNIIRHGRIAGAGYRAIYAKCPDKLAPEAQCLVIRDVEVVDSCIGLYHSSPWRDKWQTDMPPTAAILTHTLTIDAGIPFATYGTRREDCGL